MRTYHRVMVLHDRTLTNPSTFIRVRVSGVLRIDRRAMEVVKEAYT